MPSVVSSSDMGIAFHSLWHELKGAGRSRSTKNMNLFCVSLEGSTDSLYEPALNKPPLSQEHSITVPSRPSSHHSSPSLMNRATWRGSDLCIPMEPSETQKSNLNTKMRRSHVPTPSTSPNEILETDRVPCQRTALAVEVRQELNREQRHPVTQTGNAEADTAESTGTLARFQRLVKMRKGPQTGLDDRKTESSGQLGESVFTHNSPVINCIGQGMKTETTSDSLSIDKRQTESIIGEAGEGPWSIGFHDHPTGPGEVPPPWDQPYHTCNRPPGEPRHNGFDLTLPRATAWDHFENMVQELDSKQTPAEFSTPRIIRSITDLDISEYTRSTSFGRYNTNLFRHHPLPVKKEDNGGSLAVNEEQVESSDQTRSEGIGKKMKNMSSAMRKRIGRKYSKALSEELISDKSPTS
ncbi:hypothetical protein DPEC_G00233350 [Dallia pectoralis]|uniref:Uncharacterized protein n=1 Tax=Dallia pectoralis TaxID=75939 RepID=A0ACC2FXD5_DALPE|nr:hypothetical protein DPEC_G00233350 [Dallia pectoralis]